MISTTEVVLRLLLAAALGAVIGVERERREWAAGLRTHMLVSMGAALAIIVSAYGFYDVLQDDNVILDPSRIAAQVVSGIGFLGAGTILFLQREQIIRGLTTAAGLWAVAAIGLAVGSGLYLAAVVATLIASLIMAGLRPIERHFFNHRGVQPRMFIFLRDEGSIVAIRKEMVRLQVPLREAVLLSGDQSDDKLELLFGLGVTDDQLTALADELRKLPGVASLSYGSAAATAKVS